MPGRSCSSSSAPFGKSFPFETILSLLSGMENILLRRACRSSCASKWRSMSKETPRCRTMRSNAAYEAEGPSSEPRSCQAGAADA
eukprot:2853924-Pleurochrysis_carterae.AAC.1